jgi:hypothetical protein
VERIMRIALLSLMGATAFKVAYATLYIEDVRERDAVEREAFEAGLDE